ncbi:MAG TPA: sulfotransferase domain-containing protein, partial [Geminicoccaceae bacterium]|nr:sulfotransferase domain-containing protein [Geminicoccaceae bacterium]
FIAHRGDPRWRRLGMGGWGEHVRAWRALAAKVPNLWLRYEDLLDDPERELARLCRFLGLTLDRDAIRAAVAGASFANMRSLEERELRAGRPGLFAQQGFRKGQQSGRRFVNRGRADWGRDRLSPDQIARLAETFAAELELLGYTRPPAPLRAVGT